MLPKLKLLVVVLTMMSALSNAQLSTETSTLEDFIKKNGTPVEEEDIKKSIKYFLDTNFNRRTEQVVWLDGTLTSVAGNVYGNLKIKFNTINNSLYLKNNGTVYKINYNGIESFSVVEDEREKEFRRGFILFHLTTITAVSKISTSEILKYLVAYSNFHQIDITELISTEKSQELSIKINTFSREPIYQLTKYLSEKKGIQNVRLEFEELNIRKNTFLEVVLDAKMFSFLKHNYKNISQNESNSLVVSHSQRYVYEKNYYFFSNSENEIQKMIFTEKSIKNSLAFVEMKEPTDLPSFSNSPSLKNEIKLVDWLKGI